MKNKTSPMTKCFMFLSFFILVFIVIFNFYQRLSNTPKKIFIDAITSLKSDYKYLYDMKNNNYEFLNNNFSYNGNLTIKIEPHFLDFIKLNDNQQKFISTINYLNNLEINYNLLKKDNEILLELNNSYKDNDLNLSYYINENNHYIKLKQYDDYYININDIFNSLNNEITYIEDQEYIIDFILKSFINNLDNEYFKTVIEEINFEDKEITVNKNILTLDRKTITEILNKIIAELKEDDKANKILTDIYPEFSEFKIDVQENLENDIVLYFNTYTHNNELIKYELEASNLNKSLNLQINNITLSFIEKDNKIELLIDNNKIAHINFKQNKDNYNTEIFINENKIIEIDINDLENEKNISVTSELLPNNNFDLKLTEILDKNSLEEYDKLENKLLMNCNLLGMDLLKLEVINTAKIYDYADIKISLENSKNINELSKENQSKLIKILTNFYKFE